jgi:hypothetical protein
MVIDAKDLFFRESNNKFDAGQIILDPYAKIIGILLLVVMDLGCFRSILDNYARNLLLTGVMMFILTYQWKN